MLGLSEGSAACAAIIVEPGHPIRLEVNDPHDLAFHWKVDGYDRTQDAFQFGRETLTLSTPGRYEIQITAVEPSHLRAQLALTQTVLSTEKAQVWEALESQSSAAKKSRTIGEINAALDRWQAEGDVSGISRTHLQAGDALIRAGNLPAARESYDKALQLCRALQDSRCIAEAANNIGLVERQLGDFERSGALLDEAARLWKQLGFPENEGRAHSNLGVLYSRIGDYQRAIASFDRAGRLLAGRDALAYGRVLNNLGLTYLDLADYAKARIYFANSISVETSAKNSRVDLLRARLNLGRALMLDGHLQQAQKRVESVLADPEIAADPPLKDYATDILGQVLLKRGQFEAAASRLSEALELHAAHHDRRWQAIAQYWLGENYRRQGDFAKARDPLEESLRLRHAIGLRDEEVNSLEALARLEFQTSHAGEARDFAQKGLDLLESLRERVPGPALRASYLARRRGFFNLLVDIGARPDNPNAAADGFLALERSRGRALLDLIATRPNAGLPDLDLLNRRAKLRGELRLLSLKLSSEAMPSPLAYRQVEELLARDAEIEARILDSAARLESGAQPIASAKEFARDVLPSGSALIEYQLGEQTSRMWILNSDGIQMFELPSSARMETEAARVRSLLGQVDLRRRDAAKQAAFEQSLDWLSRALLGRIPAQSLRPRVMIVPDGVLNGIPFSALKLPGGEPLGLRYDLVQIPSAGYLLHVKPTRAISAFPLTALVLADPVFSAGDGRMAGSSAPPPATQSQQPEFARLPFTGEVDILTKLIPTAKIRVVRGFDASVKMLAAMPQAPAILHFSTHAVIDDKFPELSYIVLSSFERNGTPANGQLLPHQIAALHLAGSTIVVSACRTALGQQVFGEGLIGLSASLFSAGASQLVLTLSDVDAEASSELLKVAYSHLFSPGGVTMEHAMTLARRALQSSPRWTDPAYWATFVVIGAPAPPRKVAKGL